jgi:hypothetical protein
MFTHAQANRGPANVQSYGQNTQQHRHWRHVAGLGRHDERRQEQRRRRKGPKQVLEPKPESRQLRLGRSSTRSSLLGIQTPTPIPAIIRLLLNSGKRIHSLTCHNDAVIISKEAPDDVD